MNSESTNNENNNKTSNDRLSCICPTVRERGFSLAQVKDIHQQEDFLNAMKAEEDKQTADRANMETFIKEMAPLIALFVLRVMV